MKTFFDIFNIILLFTLNSYLFGPCTSRFIPREKVTLANGILEVRVSDPNYELQNIITQFNVSCKQITNYWFHQLIIKQLHYNECKMMWTMPNLNFTFCKNGILWYKITAYQLTQDLTRQIVTSGRRNITYNAQNVNNNIRFALFSHDTSSYSDTCNNNLSSPSKPKCINSITTTNRNREICKENIIFEQVFNKIDWTKWNVDIRMPSYKQDGDFVLFQNYSQNLYTKDGSLYILPKLLAEIPSFNEYQIRRGTLDLGISCTGKDAECKREARTFRILPPVVSARITTKNTFSFKYGAVEVKAKLPKGDWLFPQLFLEPLNNYYGNSNYSSGQIRLAFIRGNEILNSKGGEMIDGRKLFGGVVLTIGEQLREHWMNYSILNKKEHFGNNYHIYKVIWTDKHIKFSVDGKEYYTLHSGKFEYEASKLNIKHAKNWNKGDKMAPFDQEFFLSLGVSAGGISDFPDDCTNKPWTNTEPKNELYFWKARERWHSTWRGEESALKIKYIRVWAL